MSKDGLPALHFASRSGQETIVQILLNICDVNRQDKQGYTALDYAAAEGHPAIVYMLRKKDRVNVDLRSKTGLTPLWLAANNGHVEVLLALLKRMVEDIEAWIPVPLPRANIEARDFDHQTPLIHAAKGGDLNMVRLLVSCGADAEARDAVGFTPLSWAIKRRHGKVMDFLLERGCLWVSKDSSREDVLLDASMRGDEVMVRRMLMLDNIAIETRGIGNRTPLSWAAGNGHLIVVKLLLNQGAKVTSSDDQRKSPLLWASENGYDVITTLLVQSIVNRIIQRSFRPFESQTVRWSGYMMAFNLTGQNGVWRYFVLHRDSLTVHKSWESVSGTNKLASVDIRHHSSTSTPPPCDICDLFPQKSRPKGSELSGRYNDRLYHFFLGHRYHNYGKDSFESFFSEPQCYHFAVTTKQERNDWIRELMLVKAY